jgi:hypothetical protein
MSITTDTTEEMHFKNDQEYEEEEEEDEFDELLELEWTQKNKKTKQLRRNSVFSKSIDPVEAVSYGNNNNSTCYCFNEDLDSSYDEDDYEFIRNKKFEAQFSKEKTEEQRLKIKQTLSSIVIFKHLYDEELEKLIDSTFEKVCLEQEIIIREGDNGHYFYIIYSGVYEIFIKEKFSEINTNNHQNDDDYHKHGNKYSEYIDSGFFGELSLLYNQVYHIFIFSCFYY